MEFSGILGVLRRRLVVLLLCVGVGAAVAVIYTRSAPREFESEVQLFVRIRAATDVTEQLQGVQLTSQLLQSYARVAMSQPVAAQVARRLAIPEGDVHGRISAAPEPETLILRVRGTATSAPLARAIANAAGQVVIATIDDLEEQGSVSATVVDPADVPQAPIRPRPRLNLALGLFLGVVGGLGGALLQEQLDRSIKEPTQGVATFSAPLLAVVPRRRDATTQPLVAATNPSASASEAFRALRTAVRFIDPDSPIRSVLVTSPSAGEGKTSTAANLAIALAQSGERVVLVDADLRRARLAEHFGLESAVGLTSVVTHQVALADALQGWQDDLAILTSGPLPPNPAEILGSQSMSVVIDELAALADVVVFDAPPVLPVTDAVVLSTQVDAVVLVARSGKTQRNEAAEASRRLSGVGAHVIGFVLNAAPGSAARGYYDADYSRPVASRVSLPRRRASDLVEDRARSLNR